jgi:oligoendopeptidase F
MKRTEAQAKYKWDFSHLYKTTDDWKKDLEKLVSIIKEIATLKGKLNDEKVFFQYLELDEKSDMVAIKLMQYLHLLDIDQTNNELQELEGLYGNAAQQIGPMVSFVAPELKAIGQEQILTWIKNSKEWSKELRGFTKFFEEAKHILDEKSEALLSKVARSRGAIYDMYDSIAYADRQEVEIEWQGKVQPLTTTLYMEILEDSDPIKDQAKRLEAAKLFSKNFVDKKHSFAKIYEGIIIRGIESNHIRNYPSSLEASLKGDNVAKDIYLKLLDAGTKSIDVFKRFSNIIKNHYKLDKFYPTDRQLKLVKEYNRTFSVEEAKAIITEAVKPMGPEYAQKLSTAWTDHYIDFYEDTNKRDGAYSSGGASVEPIILMNWDDKLNSVNTLAHESGHSVHTLFADANQPYPLSEYPIILAEVASTMNEHLLFDYLYKTTTDKNEKIYLLQQRIHDLVSTYYRQIQFADFEYQAHLLVEAGQPLTADILGKLFKDVEQKYGYDVFEKSDKIGYGWPRISHFFHSPFYVYKYAVDVVASYKLFNDLKNGNTDNILNFLKAGGKKDPLDIMLDAGIDFTKDATYQPLVDAINSMCDELENLL